MIDASGASAVARVALAARPDYVRFVGATNELWVTEPSASEIEIFSLDGEGTPAPTAAISVFFPQDAHNRSIAARGRRRSIMAQSLELTRENSSVGEAAR